MPNIRNEAPAGGRDAGRAVAIRHRRADRRPRPGRRRAGQPARPLRRARAGDRQGRPRSSPSRARSRSTTRRCASCSWSACATASSRPWRFRRSSTTRRCSGDSHASTAPASSTGTRCSSRSTSPSSNSCCARSSRSHPSVEVRLGVALDGFVDDGRQVQARLRGADGDAVAGARALPGRRRRRELARAPPARPGVRRAAPSPQDWLIVDALDVPNPIDHCRVHLRSAPADAAHGRAGRTPALGVHAPARASGREEMERPESVRRLLAPWCDVDAIRIERTAVYRFHARVAKSFSKGRCFLAGDAAHVTPPFAGQGLVAGLRDVANLAWKLAWVVRGQARETDPRQLRRRAPPARAGRSSTWPASWARW